MHVEKEIGMRVSVEVENCEVGREELVGGEVVLNGKKA
jgi:hypothetical protein